jgi:hypothetical protein
VCLLLTHLNIIHLLSSLFLESVGCHFKTFSLCGHFIRSIVVVLDVRSFVRWCLPSYHFFRLQQRVVIISPTNSETIIIIVVIVIVFLCSCPLSPRSRHIIVVGFLTFTLPVCCCLVNGYMVGLG